MVPPPPYSYENITTATTTQVASGSGELGRVIVNKPVASAVIAIHDGLSAAGDLIGTITLPATLLSDGPVCVDYGVAFGVGLCIVTTGAPDVTVCYR